MLRVGLTGGIGSGKSMVAHFFAELGVAVIDTDVIAREVVVPNSPAITNIVEYFGAEILNANGELDRKKLRDIVFKSKKDRLWLEALLHPLIRAAVSEKILQVNSPYCILVIPLLVESKSNPMVDRILVVDATEQQQIERTQKRDQLQASQVRAIMKAQVTRAQRLAAANDVINNDHNLNHLREQVHKLHIYYLQLSKQ